MTGRRAVFRVAPPDYIRKPLDPRLFLARVTATLRRTAGWLANRSKTA